MSCANGSTDNFFVPGQQQAYLLVHQQRWWICHCGSLHLRYDADLSSAQPTTLVEVYKKWIINHDLDGNSTIWNNKIKLKHKYHQSIHPRESLTMFEKTSPYLSVFREYPRHIKSPVITINVGLAASMASFLLAAGEKGKRALAAS